jgi:hypothetical protein
MQTGSFIGFFLQTWYINIKDSNKNDTWVIIKNLIFGQVWGVFMKNSWEVFCRWEYKFVLYTVVCRIKLCQLYCFIVLMFLWLCLAKDCKSTVNLSHPFLTLDALFFLISNLKVVCPLGVCCTLLQSSSSFLGLCVGILAYAVLVLTFSVYIVIPVSDQVTANQIFCYSLVWLE